MTHLIVINLLFSVIIVFFQRRDPRSVWTWLLALNFIPVFGIVFIHVRFSIILKSF